MTLTQTKAGVVLVGILILIAAYGVTYTSQEVAQPRRIDRAVSEDDTRQVIIQVWWSPGRSHADMQWRIGALAQGSKTQEGATPRLPFERRGRVKRGEPVFLGWAIKPGPLAYVRWRIWLSGQVVKSGESKSPTMSITETPWG